MPDALQARAPAKINLTLEVLGKREDGYHEIETVLQTLEIADVVTVTEGRGGVSVSGPFADGVPADESNLVLMAAQALGRVSGRDFRAIHVHLEKNIPAAGGLGGGASDAATTLRLLQQASSESHAALSAGPSPAAAGAGRTARDARGLGTDITDKELLGAAVAVGSDEAFFLVGGTARATGRGEAVTALPDIPEHGVVVFVPPETLDRKTARLFAALSELPFDDGSVTRALVERPPERIRGADIFNAFERVAFDVFPGLAELWEDLETRIGEPIHLAGAGPTLFWIGPVEETAWVAGKAAGLACTVIETRTSASLWRR